MKPVNVKLSCVLCCCHAACETVMFSVLLSCSQKQKSKSLFIALLALSERGNCSRRSLQKSETKKTIRSFKRANRSFAFSLSQNEQFARKPKSEFPTLVTVIQPANIFISVPVTAECYKKSCDPVPSFFLIKSPNKCPAGNIIQRW